MTDEGVQDLSGFGFANPGGAFIFVFGRGECFTARREINAANGARRDNRQGLFPVFDVPGFEFALFAEIPAATRGERLAIG